MKAFKIGLDAYSLKPLSLGPFEILDWAAGHGADGVQFSEPPVESADRAFLKDLRSRAGEAGLYLEWGGGRHIPFDPRSRAPLDIAASNRRTAEQAAELGAATVRSCSGGLMRWEAGDLPVEDYLEAMIASLKPQAAVFRDLGVILAIETHFEFTTFELRRLFERCGAEPGGWLGICLDTMNLLTMLEDPVRATRRILPWIAATHIKDGGIIRTAEGFRSFTAEAGTGIVDFPSVFEDLATLDRTIHLSVEDHGGDFPIPISDPAFRAKFPDLDEDELRTLDDLARRTREKLDRKETAVLDRDRWPGVCEKRVERDLRAVRILSAPDAS